MGILYSGKSLRHRCMLALTVLAAALAVACGAAATATPSTTDSGTGTTPTTAGGPTPTAAAAATTPPGQSSQPAGTLNVGQKEIGVFEGHPQLTSSPRIQFVNLSVGEGLVKINDDLSAGPLLAKSWSISDDFLTWTFNLQEGVEFHKGYGEMAAEDVLYTYEKWAEGALHARANFMGNFWNHPDGGSTIIDPLTIEVDVVEPWVSARVFEFLRTLGGSSTWIVSKKQSEELGVEAAGKNIASTGPWEIVDHKTGEFWRFRAVEDHWRQTPYFDELVFWEIPEESSRVAGFQTGKLDTFDMAFDSIPVVEQVPGAVLVNKPNAGQAGLNLYGQYYLQAGTPDQAPGYDPELAWVSSNPDPASEEWKNAVKVKQAMAMAIDRETIVETLLRGFASPMPLRDWAGHEAKMLDKWQWDYNPERAQELLAEAGYPDGFSITLSPAIRGAPAEVEACEAVSQFWRDIGIDVEFQRIPYSTIRPTFISRSYKGATCHSVSVRLHPIIGLSNYVDASVFTYGTFHPWMEEHISDGLGEVDPVELDRKTVEIYDWMFDNVMAFGLYSFDAVWPIGSRVNPEWDPVDFSEVRIANGFEYVQPR